jgi:hypothetical protein
MMGMDKHIFRALVTSLSYTSGLCAGKYVSTDEKVAIFLRAAVSGGTNRELQERFQWGGATISLYVFFFFPSTNSFLYEI